MKILFDHLCFWQKYGGVPKYFTELIKRLPVDDVILTVKLTNNEYVKDLGVNVVPFLPNMAFRGKSKVESLLGRIWSIPHLMHDKFDIYHQTHYDPYAYKYLSPSVKKVTTIHDMNFFTIPSLYTSFSQRLKTDQIVSMNKADHIITISNCSKNDICRYLNCAEDKISVIYHGIDKVRFSSANIIEQKNEYILFVGGRDKYKNFEGLVMAFAALKNYSDLYLYCSGLAPSKHDLDMIRKYNLDGRVRFFQSTNAELVDLYANAVCFVFPSFYEGFGLPILEAMAAGCPVVLSNTSCFPEIAQDAGEYFDPYSVDSIKKAIDNVLSNKQYRQLLIERGHRRVADFSWDKCAEAHINVYKSLLNL